MTTVHLSDDLLTRHVKPLPHGFWHQLPQHEVTEEAATLTESIE